jgi:putative hydrolase of the HAD superfamily
MTGAPLSDIQATDLCSWVISAVLFDLDETLFDRTTSLVLFLAYQHGRFADRLGEVTFEVWRDRFLALDARGYVHKSLVYLALLTEFSGDLTAVDALLDDYREHCREHARGSPGMAATLMALSAHTACDWASSPTVRPSSRRGTSMLLV